jgi:hypothetical protein
MGVDGLLLYIGSAVIFLWGVGHLIPTRNVVADFGEISIDNRRIITMEWLIEGLALCFLGLLVAISAAVLGPQEFATQLISRLAGGMLLALAGVSLFTGARTPVLPMKLCPVVKTAVATMFFIATF